MRWLLMFAAGGALACLYYQQLNDRIAATCRTVNYRRRRDPNANPGAAWQAVLPFADGRLLGLLVLAPVPGIMVTELFWQWQRNQLLQSLKE